MNYPYLTFAALCKLSAAELRDIARLFVPEDRYVPLDKDVIARGHIMRFLRDAVGNRTRTKDEVIRAATIKAAKGLAIEYSDWGTVPDDELINRIRQAWLEKYRKRLDALSDEERRKVISEMQRQQELRARAAGLSSASAAAVAAAEMSGFAIYAATTTTIAAVGSAVGVTFPFAVYQGATTALGTVLGPVGWVLAGGTAVASAAFWAKARSDKQAVVLQTVVIGILLGLAPWLWYEVPITVSKAEVDRKYRHIARSMHPDTVSTEVPGWMLSQTTEWFITATDYRNRINESLNGGGA
jgi:uncharacterized protein YaaW (UPF0174 family)